MKKIIQQKGSAILLALMMILMILPLAVGLLSLNMISGKNVGLNEDSQVSEATAQSGINDLKARYNNNHNFLGDGNCYYVEVDTNAETQTPPAAKINPSLIKRSHKYYEVCRALNAYVITSYYAGVKHSYSILFPPGEMTITRLW